LSRTPPTGYNRANMKRITDWLAYVAVRLVVCLIQTLRMETCHRAARRLAVLACDVLKIRSAVVDDNIRHVFPQLTPDERRTMARRMWEHLLLMVCELAHTPRKVHETNWRQFMRFPRDRESVGYLLGDRPVIMVSGHFGNFEFGSYMVGLLGYSGYVIARPLDNPFLDRFVASFRARYRQSILPKLGSAGQAEAVLKAGGRIGLLGDQHAGPRGCWVDFLGRPASCHKAVALLSLVGGAVLMVTCSKRVGGPMRFEGGLVAVADPEKPGPEMANVKSLTRWYNLMLEKVILEAPDQYWWLHRRWKGEPPHKSVAAEKAEYPSAA
jgi:Kdo2-lipid IVA lauroyltransferase/acyltransferase